MRDEVSGNKKRILYVEDHKLFGETISRLLSDYEVTIMPTLAKGLACARQEKFDLYLLDFNLPDGDGIELCRQIKTFDTETPVLFLTVSLYLTEAEVKEAGAQGLLLKGKAGFIEHLLQQVSLLLENPVEHIS
jgi:DNA-binding response OmpR family regulator